MAELQQESETAVSYGAAEIGALAHLYRGEMYQSKIWRNRLDTTSNWAIVITGIALSVSFSHEQASSIPILLVTLVAVIFLYFESRRYLYYDLFRVRVRVMEINFYGPMLRGHGIDTRNHWNDLLANDYDDLRFHITLMEAIGRRVRRTYGWIFGALFICYVAKVFVHPTPLATLAQLWDRAAIGPIPGQFALGFGLIFHCTWVAVAVLTLKSQKAVGLPRARTGPDALIEVAGGHMVHH